MMFQPVLSTLLRELQIQGEFTYGDLAEGLTRKLGIPLLVAQRSVLQFAAESHGVIIEEYPMVKEPPPTTIEETIAGWRKMADALKPKKVKAKPGSRNADSAVSAEFFEQYRPQRSLAKWLKGAPDCIMGCYDNATDSERYTIVFGGRFWTAEHAFANWQAGLDPRVAQCLRMAECGTPIWIDCLPTRALGRKICWLDLPPDVCEHVEKYTHGSFRKNSQE